MMAAAKTYPFKIKQIPRNRKPGKIIYDRPHKREPHEEATAQTLAQFGYDLQFICVKNLSHISTPDCLWRNEFWEMKSPKKNSSKNILDCLKGGLRQSQKIIIDVTRSRRGIARAAGDVIGYINHRKNTRIRKIFILDRENYCLIEKNDVLL